MGYVKLKTGEEITYKSDRAFRFYRVLRARKSANVECLLLKNFT